MTDRVTIKHCYAPFALLCKALGKTQGTDARSGQWALDNNPGYGGICIVEQAPTGGESRPFGLYSRMPAREFYGALNFALYALDIRKGG